MAPRSGTEERYAVQVGELWSWLSPSLTNAAWSADVQSLCRLQYALHVAGEQAYGLEPPQGAASAHAELADALGCARDVTGEIASGYSLFGAAGIEPLLAEWHGSLLRVRLARMRLAAPVPRPVPPPHEDEGIGGPLAAFLLALGGALAFVAGATLAVWPVWTLGMAAVCASILAYRP